jgi:hypothetical protein
VHGLGRKERDPGRDERQRRVADRVGQPSPDLAEQHRDNYSDDHADACGEEEVERDRPQAGQVEAHRLRCAVSLALAAAGRRGPRQDRARGGAQADQCRRVVDQ